MKKVLLITPKFYDYDKHLIETLTKKNYQVTVHHYNDHLLKSKKFFVRAVHRNLLSLKNERIRDFVEKKKFLPFNSELLEAYPGRYDFLIVIKGYGLFSKTVENINAKQKILYQWDSIHFYPTVTKIYKSFDQVFTFDPHDAENGHGTFLPNFTMPRESKEATTNFKNAAFFIGKYSEYRYSLLKRVKTILKKNNIESYFTLVCSPKTYRKLSTERKSSSFVTDQAISTHNYNIFFEKSSYIIELSAIGQTGKTQRYYEALAGGKKVILLSEKTICEEILANSVISDEKDFDIDKLEINNWLDILLSSKSHRTSGKPNEE